MKKLIKKTEAAYLKFKNERSDLQDICQELCDGFDIWVDYNESDGLIILNVDTENLMTINSFYVLTINGTTKVSESDFEHLTF